MLQNEVLKTPRRAFPGRRDPRTAALAVAASAAALLTFPVPPAVPPLAPGFGRSAPASPPGLSSSWKTAAARPASPIPPGKSTGRPSAEEDPLMTPGNRLEAGVSAPALTASGFGRRSSAPDAAPERGAAVRVESRRLPAPARGGFGRHGTAPASFVSSIEAKASDRRRGGGRAGVSLAMKSVTAPAEARTRGPIERRAFKTASAALRGGSAGRAADRRGGVRPRTREDRAEARGAGKAARRSRSGRRRKAPAERRAKRGGEDRRFKPLLLASLIGPRALRPPPAGLEPPATPADWAARRPERGPDGRPLTGAPAGLDALDAANPAVFGRDRRAGAHWDAEVWHDGDARGLASDGGWLRLQREGERWWAFAGGDGRAQLRHDGVWWTKEGGIWFVVHDGRPWAWRSFQDWDAQGLFQPGSGTEMVYSKDFARVAVIIPGEGARVFDAATGAELARIPEERLPPRRRTKRPAILDQGSVDFDR